MLDNTVKNKLYDIIDDMQYISDNLRDGVIDYDETYNDLDQIDTKIKELMMILEIGPDKE